MYMYMYMYMYIRTHEQLTLCRLGTPEEYDLLIFVTLPTLFR